MNNSSINPRSAVFAEEAFVVDVQSFLHRLMEEKSINKTQLAAAMGVTKARVSQIFSDECKNFTVRLLARACHALGEEPRITSGTCDLLDLAVKMEEQDDSISCSRNVHRIRAWDVEDWTCAEPLACDDKASKKYSRALFQAMENTGRDQARMAVTQ